MHLDYRNTCMLIAILGTQNFCFEQVSETMKHVVGYFTFYILHFTSSRKVPVSIPDDFIEFFNRPNSSSNTQPLIPLSL
jgi:hypothetical protein